MSAPTIVRDLVVAHTRALKLPGVARAFEPLARLARDAHWPHEDYLHEVLSAEQASRHESLIRQLIEARDTRELTRLQQRLLRVDVLIVDELGFVPFDRPGGELLFNLLTDRYERRATVVTTNRLCGAPHNRFVVIAVDAASWRRTKTSRRSWAAEAPSFFIPTSSSTSRSTRVRCCTKSRRAPLRPRRGPQRDQSAPDQDAVAGADRADREAQGVRQLLAVQR